MHSASYTRYISQFDSCYVATLGSQHTWVSDTHPVAPANQISRSTGYMKPRDVSSSSRAAPARLTMYPTSP